VNEVDLNRKFLETGDRDAFNVIFERYYPLVYASVAHLMRNHTDVAVDADDITQETFIKAFTEREIIREPEKLLSWLKTTARNAVFDSRKATKSAANRLPEGTQHVSYEELSIGDRDVATTSLLKERHAEADERDRHMVAQLLFLLSGKDSVVTAFVLEGLAPKEIAEETGDTPGAIQKRWERIRQWLAPIARNLEPLLDCLPEGNDREIMERYLDNQPLAEISDNLRLSPSDIEAVVKRVIKDWKKSARQNPEAPAAAMVNNER